MIICKALKVKACRPEGGWMLKAHFLFLHDLGTLDKAIYMGEGDSGPVAALGHRAPASAWWLLRQARGSWWPWI